MSCLVFENRRPDGSAPQVPGGPVQAAFDDMRRLWERLRDAEARHSLAFLREPDPGFTWSSWRWTGGAELEQVLADDPDLTAGDFVRSCKQLIDLLSQVALVAEEPVRSTARTALEQVRRGVIAW